jgi:hypothetical protein
MRNILKRYCRAYTSTRPEMLSTTTSAECIVRHKMEHQQRVAELERGFLTKASREYGVTVDFLRCLILTSRKIYFSIQMSNRSWDYAQIKAFSLSTDNRIEFTVIPVKATYLRE